MSMPYVGLLLFLRNQGGSTGNQGVCQCPTSGFFYFYIAAEWRYRLDLLVCQCPTSGFFYFYEEVLYVVGAIAVVSMPYVGLLLFLRIKSCAKKLKQKVSMPYVGLLLFLLPVIVALINSGLCQCPTSGFFYFYQKFLWNTVDYRQCQCPTSGFFYFYRRDFVV